MGIGKGNATRGGRKSSPLLWKMVKVLSEDEWRQLSAFSQVYGKGSLQFQLLSFLRFSDNYEPEKERKLFSGNSLPSLRHAAKQWLIRTANRLAIDRHNLIERFLDIDVLLRWRIFDDISEMISEAKAIAWDQERFDWLLMISKQEIELAKANLSGTTRSKRLAELSNDVIEIGNLIVLQATIENYSAIYLEGARNSLLTTGTFRYELAEEYFESDFYKKDISNWPKSLQIQKLRIDEALYYYSQRVESAAIIAEKELFLSQGLDAVKIGDSQTTARLLFRLLSYYSELGNRYKVDELLDVFRDKVSVTIQNDQAYQRRLIYSLLTISYEFADNEIGEEGVEIWRKNNTQFELANGDIVALTNLLLVCSYFVSKRKVSEAKECFRAIMLQDALERNLSFELVSKILHLIILIEENDERGMLSFGKNYKRHIKALLKSDPNSSVLFSALEIVEILSRLNNSLKKAKTRSLLLKLVERLAHYQDSKEITLKPFLFPVSQWAKLRL